MTNNRNTVDRKAAKGAQFSDHADQFTCGYVQNGFCSERFSLYVNDHDYSQSSHAANNYPVPSRAVPRILF